MILLLWKPATPLKFKSPWKIRTHEVNFFCCRRGECHHIWWTRLVRNTQQLFCDVNFDTKNDKNGWLYLKQMIIRLNPATTKQEDPGRRTSWGHSRLNQCRLPKVTAGTSSWEAVKQMISLTSVRQLASPKQRHSSITTSPQLHFISLTKPKQYSLNGERKPGNNFQTWLSGWFHPYTYK